MPLSTLADCGEYVLHARVAACEELKECPCGVPFLPFAGCELVLPVEYDFVRSRAGRRCHGYSDTEFARRICGGLLLNECSAGFDMRC